MKTKKEMILEDFNDFKVPTTAICLRRIVDRALSNISLLNDDRANKIIEKHNRALAECEGDERLEDEVYDSSYDIVGTYLNEE
jgi:hypothetical protein